MNWIQAKFDSSMDSAWKKLVQQIEQDLKIYGDLAEGSTERVWPELKENDIGISIEEEHSLIKRWVALDKKEDHFLIRKSVSLPEGEGTTGPQLTPTVTAKAEFCFLYSEKDTPAAEVEIWQASRLCLEPLLFQTQARWKPTPKK